MANNDKRPSPLQEWLAVTLLKLTGLLPLWLSRGLGVLVGWLGVVLSSRSYRTTLRNLELCYPQMDSEQRILLARQSLRETGKLMFETGAVWRRSMDWLNRHIHGVHGQPVLQAAIDSGKGVLLLLPHMGNWEVMGLFLPEFGSTTTLYSPPDFSSLDKLIRNARQKSGATLVPANRRGVAALVKALKAGQLIIILPDQVPEARSGGEFAPFFNVPARTMTLVNNLRKSTDCRVVAGCIERVSGGFDVHFLHVEDGINSDDEQEALAALNRTVEHCVAINPAQYQWEYKRFRKQPGNAPNPYAKG